MSGAPEVKGETPVHPVLVIFCFLSGAFLFGVVGVIMAVPVALIVKINLALLYDEPARGRAGKRVTPPGPAALCAPR